ncbi:MAG TPA: ABC transporter permease [Candidatus Acidoferrales bacterium]|nr:ABC transporter permease [Candidatus Acidoferrales bacterium]
MLARIRSFVWTVVRRATVERELDDEMKFHLEARAEDLMREGVTLAEARRRARLEFGGVDKAKEASREARGVSFVDSLAQDLRFGARMLRKSPGFTAVAVITLALGIGANTAIFSVVNGVVLRPLPFKNSQRVVTIWWGAKSRDLANGSASLESAAEYTPGDLNLSGDGAAERIPAAEVSESFFRVFALAPERGRTFTPQDEAAGHPPIAILSHELWVTRYHADPNIFTRTIFLNGKGYAPVGVMPTGFDFPSHAQVWLPFPPTMRENVFGGNAFFAFEIARLRPDATPGAARSELQVIQDRETASQIEGPRPDPVRVQTLHDYLAGDTSQAALLLFAAVGFVVLIACADVANLLLARGAGRTREVAVRRTLGASRGRLVRQFLIESILLSVLGGIFGLLMGWWAIDASRSLLPARDAFAAPVTLDRWVLGFTFALAILTGILAGIIPALHSSGADFAEALKEGTRSSHEGFRLGFRTGLRSLLGISEIALALILVIGATLFLRSLNRLMEVNPGFDSSNILVAHLSLLGPKYTAKENRAVFLQKVLTRARALPGVEAASFVTALPLDTSMLVGMQVKTIDSRKSTPSPGQFSVYTVVSPGYFSTMHIPLRAGRDFNESDMGRAHPVAIVSEKTAKSFWPGQNPLGHTFSFADANSKESPYEVVGVAGDVRSFGLDGDPGAAMYFPVAQENPDEGSLLVRADRNPLALGGAMRDIIRNADADEPVSAFTTLEQVLDKTVASPRFRSLLLGIFGALALLLAWVGVYSVISYTVEQRTHEIGIRMALGAERRNILAIVTGYGLRLVVAGLAIGLTGAYFLGKLVASFLFSVKPADPVAFGLGAVIVAGIVLVASYVPARRAMRVDPLVALRHE